MPVKKRLNYTQMTLRENRERGRICDKTERWNAFAGPHGRREDLFGFIDLIALDPKKGIVAIQSTGPSGRSSHQKKILENEWADGYNVAIEWLKAGGKIELWSWRKLLVKRGGKRKRWYPKIEEITYEDFDNDQRT